MESNKSVLSMVICSNQWKHDSLCRILFFQKIPMISVFHWENTLYCHRLCFFFCQEICCGRSLSEGIWQINKVRLWSFTCMWFRILMKWQPWGLRLICKNQEKRLSATWRQICWQLQLHPIALMKVWDFTPARQRLPWNTPGLFAAGWQVSCIETNVSLRAKHQGLSERSYLVDLGQNTKEDWNMTGKVLLDVFS